MEYDRRRAKDDGVTVPRGLRKELQEVLDAPEPGNDIRRILEISERHSGSIRLVQRVVPEIVEDQFLKMEISYNYNCFAFALDLHKDEEAKNLMIAAKDKAYPDIYVSPEFIHHLLTETRDLLIEINQIANEEPYYAIYFNKEWPKHAGNFLFKKIVSKWGAGHIWEHALFEIPESYGNEVRFYRTMPRRKLVDAFLAWTKSKAQGL